MSRPHPRPSLRWGPAAALASLFLAGAATPALAGGHHHRGKTERMILVPAPRVVVISAAPTRTTVRVIEREVYRVASTPAAPAPAPMPAGRDLEMERSLEGLAKSMPAPASYGERDFASSQAMESSLQGYVDRGPATAPPVVERVYIREAAPVVERVYIREAPATRAILIDRAPKHRLFHHKD